MLETLIQNSPLFYLTQSLWRDEVFSIFVAQKPLLSFWAKLTFEPPLYYTMLHFWIKIFGTSEIATRSLSLLGFSLALVIVIFWGEKLFPKSWLQWYLPLLFFLNPMLLYYAFEVRTYGWFIFFVTASMYTFVYKKWTWFIASSVLGFYNHSYFVLVPFIQTIYYLTVERKKLFPLKFHKICTDPLIKADLVVGLVMSPWLIIIALAASKLKSSWYFPVDLNLIKSVLGNMFVGYEGTPWYGWQYTRYLSLAIITLTTYAAWKYKNKVMVRYFYTSMLLPLVIVIGISFIKPLFVNRYVIEVTIAEIFLLVFFLASIKSEIYKRFFALIFVVFCVLVNITYPKLHPKTNFRDTLSAINSLMQPADVIYAETSLSLFESQYYANDPKKVFLYNPNNSAFPWYVGDFVVTAEMMRETLPVYPARAFLVKEDGGYDIVYHKVLPMLGPAREPTKQQ